MVKRLTLSLARNETQILLGLKKRGFGAGRWNGFGGKIEPGETIREAARREFQEECGLEAEALEERGTLTLEYPHSGERLEVHLFEVTAWHGRAVETDEMLPRWFDLAAIPFDRMWPDDRHWLPVFLEGKALDGHFFFSDDHTLLHHSLHVKHNQLV